jgi:hypothetical protein
MKKTFSLLSALAVIAVLVMNSCTTPVTLTSWQNPKDQTQIKKVVVLALFNKLNYMEPFESSVVTYFNNQGIKSIRSLDFLTPYQKYETADLQKKFDSLGADAVVIFTYKGTDVTQDYSPPTYYGFYSRGWGYGGVGVAGSPGYWTTTSTVNVRANLYLTTKEDLVWTGDLQVTDPSDINASATQIAQVIFADWVKKKIVAGVTSQGK